MEDILQFLAAGGDVATVAIAYALWKFDKRLLSLEINFKNLKERIIS